MLDSDIMMRDLLFLNYYYYKWLHAVDLMIELFGRALGLGEME